MNGRSSKSRSAARRFLESGLLLSLLALPVSCSLWANDEDEFIPGELQRVRSPAVALDGYGNATVVYSQDLLELEKSERRPPPAFGRIELTRITTAKSQPITLGGVEGQPTMLGTRPSVGVTVNDENLAIVVWRGFDGPIEDRDTTIVAAMVDLRDFGVSEVLEYVELERTDEEVTEPRLAVARNGSAVVAWSRGDLVLAKFYVRGLGWIPDPIVLSAGFRAATPDLAPDIAVAINETGLGVVMHCAESGSEFVRLVHWIDVVNFVVASGRADEGSVLAPLGSDSSDETLEHRSAIAIANDGFTLAAFTVSDGGAGGSMYARAYEPGSSWQPGATLGSMANPDSRPCLRVGVDAVGNGVASWQGLDASGETHVFSDRFARSSGWAGASDLTAAPSVEFAAALAPDGAASMLYTANDAMLRSARMDPNSGWSSPADLLTLAGNPGLELVQIEGARDESGTGLFVWIEDNFNLAFQRIAKPHPFFSEDAFLKAGVPGDFDSHSTPVSTTASLARFEWDFDDVGDGVFDVAESDGSIEHTYPSAGTFTVTLRVTDTLGESASFSKPVTVDPPGSGNGSWVLFVLKSGGGTGYVSSDLDSDGDGTPDIDCGSDNQESYVDGPLDDDHAQVYLTPVADPGSVFSHWEGLDPAVYFDGDYGVDGCLVQMTANRTITAVFE